MRLPSQNLHRPIPFTGKNFLDASTPDTKTEAAESTISANDTVSLKNRALEELTTTLSKNYEDKLNEFLSSPLNIECLKFFYSNSKKHEKWNQYKKTSLLKRLNPKNEDKPSTRGIQYLNSLYPYFSQNANLKGANPLRMLYKMEQLGIITDENSDNSRFNRLDKISFTPNITRILDKIDSEK